METQQTMKPYVIGLDLGGTNSVFGIVDSRGEIKATTAIKTQAYNRVEDYVKASVEALQAIIDEVGGIDTIKGMGIGAPNANYYEGTIEYAPNIVWAHESVVPLASMFEQALGVPVAIHHERRQCCGCGRDDLWCGKGHEKLHHAHAGHGCRFGYCGQWTVGLWLRRLCR